VWPFDVYIKDVWSTPEVGSSKFCQVDLYIKDVHVSISILFFKYIYIYIMWPFDATMASHSMLTLWIRPTYP
jgi:hypothetical protein